MARRLVVPKSARSEVWKYFGFEADESGKITDVDKQFGRRFVWCRLCDAQLLFSGNTTNLSSHISRCRKVKMSQTERTIGLSIPNTSKIQNSNYREVGLQGQTDSTLQNFNESQESYCIEQPEIEMSIDEELINNVEYCPENNPSEDQQYCLKWKYHHNNQQTMFSKLLERESFCDVTIACEEKLIRAHKLVLSACSSYFEKVLSHYEDQTPIIILKDVKYDDMLTLIQFMYKGEVNVVQNELATFLETADVLKVRGLSDLCGQSLRESSDPQENSEEEKELFNNGIKPEQGKRPLRDQETPRQVKIARCGTDMELISTETSESAEENTAKTSTSDKQEGIIRLPQFLSRYGSYQDFWKKTWVIKALKAVSDKEITLKECSELLGVNYNKLYSRYRMLHGCLKDSSYETVPSTSHGYMLNSVSSYSMKDSGGNIIVTRDNTVNNSNNSNLDKYQSGRFFLRTDKLTSATVLDVKSKGSLNQGSAQSIINVKLENGEQDYKYMTEQISDDHVLESETSKSEDVGQM